jgi:adenylate cyclase
LIVGAYRSEEVILDKDGERHSLESLVNEFRRAFGDITVNVDQVEGQGFIDAFLDSEPNKLGNPFREALYQQTRGHPLFTIELLRGLHERGDLVQDADVGWIEGPALNWETLPGRVEAAIRERISRLPESLQRTLEVASVEGEEFTAEVVAGILDQGEREIVKHLSSELVRKHRLVGAQAIERIGSKRASCYRFRSYLFQKYLYDNLDEADRAYLHEDVGRGLEELYGEQASEIAVQLAWHFHEAKIMEKAIHYQHLAGTKAVQLSAYQEGIAHLEQGLALLEELPDSTVRAQLELDLQLALGMALLGSKGNVPEVEHAYIRARELCQQIGNTAQLSQVVGELSIYHYARAEYEQALQLAEEASNLAREVEEPLLEAIGHWRLGYILFVLGEYSDARSHLEQVVDFYHPEQHQTFIALRGSDVGVGALAYYACCLWCLGYPDQATQCSQEALRLARELDHPFTLADVVSYGGCLFNRMRRDSQAMMANAQELMKLADKLHAWIRTATRQHGEAVAMSGRLEEGIAQIREGLYLKEYGPERCYSTGALCSIAEAQANLGRIEEGLSTLSEAFTMVEETKERFCEAELHRLKGKLLLLEGGEKEAEASLHKAIEVARRQQARMWELRAEMDLCRLWERQGKKAEALERLEAVCSWFTEGFDTPDLIEAEKMLAGSSR